MGSKMERMKKRKKGWRPNISKFRARSASWTSIASSQRRQTPSKANQWLLNTLLPLQLRIAEIQVLSWRVPEAGWVQLNTDGFFVQPTGFAGSGSYLSSCRCLQHCSFALEAELSSIKEGPSLALEWSQLPIHIETDCPKLLIFRGKKVWIYQSFGFFVHDIKLLMAQQNTCIAHVRLNSDLASHGRGSGRTVVWLASGPIFFC